jgi:hypothetical protein
MKPFLYGLVNKLGEPHLCEMCVAESDSQFDDDWLNDNQLSVVPLYTSPQIEKMREDLDRLQKAHDHQYNMSGLMLRESERYSRENDDLRDLLEDVIEEWDSDSEGRVNRELYADITAALKRHKQ